MGVMDILANGLLSGVITGAAAYAAIRVEIRYLRRDVDLAHSRIRELSDHGCRLKGVCK